MRYVFSSVGLAFLVLGGPASYAQAPDAPDAGPRSEALLIHDQWTVRDGLPVNHANTLYQTPDGYLWLATFDGLVRFDGAQFTVFNAGNTKGLPSSRIVLIKPGQDGSFWLSTEQGHLVHVTGGRFMSFDTLPGMVSKIYEEEDGQTWIAATKGLYKHRAGQLEPAFGGALLGQPITDVLRDQHGTLWVATLNDGVWQAVGDRVQRSTVGPAQGITLFEDVDGTLWTGGHSVSRYQPAPAEAGGTWQLFTPPGAPWTRPAWQADPNGFKIWEFYREPGGPLWLATTVGLYRYTSSLGEGTQDPHAEAGRAHLTPLVEDEGVASQAFRQNNFERCPDGTLWLKKLDAIFREGQYVTSVGSDISDLFCDREGSLWLTTASTGLHRFGRALIRTYSEAEGLGHRIVYHLFEDSAGGLWIAGQDGPVSRLHDGRFQYFEVGTHFEAVHPFAGRANSGNSDHAMYEDRAGNLWMGFQVCPAARRTAAGACPRFTWAEGAPRQLVFALRETRDGALWFGTPDGLYRLHNGEWTRYTTEEGLPDSHVRYLLEARDGSLYAATLRGGVGRYRDGQFTSITTADGLASNHVRALYEDADGILWIGTEDRGLNRLDPTTGTITTIRQADGLYYDGIHQVVEDDFGRLWMSTNRGLFWVRRADLNAFARGDVALVQAVSYTERDGMRNPEANGARQQAALKASDGHLWFATQDGAVVVDPAEIEQNTSPPPVVIEQVAAAGNTVPVQQGIPVALAADRRSFRIAYTSPSFVAPERMRFRYRLAGFDPDWVEAEHRREAVYTQVPPGDYVFHVRASSNGITWNEDGTTLALSVAPFFYETWWFLALCGLGAIGLVAAAFGYRIRQLRHSEQRLEAQVAERTRALHAEKQKTEAQAEGLKTLDLAKSRFFANISHEFRTPLLLILGPLEDVQDGFHGEVPPETREQVDLAVKNGHRLLHLVNQLLDVSRLEASRLTLQARAVDAVAFIARLADLFAAMAGRKSIDFRVELPDGPLPVYLDPDQFEKIVANLLGNAVKFTPPGGTITLSATTTLDPASDGWLVVRVHDTGPGIAPEHLPHVFERFYQADASSTRRQPGTGISLALAYELVALHHGHLTAESEEGAGSTFTVRLPLGRAHLSDDELAPSETELPLGQQKSTGATTRHPILLTDTIEIDSAEPSGNGGLATTPSPAGDDVTTVLVVDDNANVRTYMRRHLEQDYRIVEAANGQAALETARRVMPDLIVSDVMMPEMDGYAFCHALKTDPELDFIPVILLTAKASAESKIEGLEEGADAYLTKPFNIRELKVLVHNLIASRRRLKARFSQDAPPVSSLLLPPGSALAPADETFAEQFREAIEAHFSDEALNVNMLAEAVGVSRATLYRRVQEVFGQSPMELVWQLRLEQAAQWLHEPDVNVSEVAYGVGFRSVSHFSNRFREHFGVSPSAFRISASRGA